MLCVSASLAEETFYAFPARKLSRVQERKFYRLLSKRLAGFPLAYITGKKEFWSISFRVCPGVFIPRPETELLVESVAGLSKKEGELIVDIGTGAGNIAISLEEELPTAKIIAMDVSRKALKTSRVNASLQENSRINFLLGSLYAPLKKLELEGKCDFIVSNPPYVPAADWDNLQIEVKNHEPKRALVAGRSGLEFIRRLIQGAPKFLSPGGYLLFEIGSGQEEDVSVLFGEGWEGVHSRKDLNGIPRVIIARR